MNSNPKNFERNSGKTVESIPLFRNSRVQLKSGEAVEMPKKNRDPPTPDHRLSFLTPPPQHYGGKGSGKKVYGRGWVRKNRE